MSNSSFTATNAAAIPSNKLPKFLLLLAFVELWERFSYYGMRALLVLYLIKELDFTDSHAYAIYGLFATVGYAGSIIFGLLADKLSGPRYLVFLGSVIMLFGHALMGCSAMYPDIIYVGLSAIAIGTSAFKGNIANILGLCYKKAQLDSANGYIWFHIAINIGAGLASIICGTIGMKFGWHYGFGLAGIGMALGLIALALYEYILEGVGDVPQMMDIYSIKISIILIAIALIVLVSYALTAPEYSMTLFKASIPLAVIYYLYVVYTGDLKYRYNLLIVGILFIFKIMAVALEMQGAPLIAVFADRNVDLNVFGYEIAAASTDAINPITIVIFGSLLAGLIKFKDKGGELLFFIGMISVPLCFAIYYIGILNATDGIVAFGYFLFGLMIMAIGELFLSPYIFTQISRLCPTDKRGFVFGFMSIAFACANVIGAIVAQTMSLSAAQKTAEASETILIYKQGFGTVGIWNFVAAIVFLVMIPLLRSMEKKTTVITQ